jgi:23S rRNA-intervening sequence protein
LPEREQSEVAVVVSKAYDLTLWLLPKMEQLPKSYRFSLGQRMVEASLDLLLALVEAAYRTDKSSLLRSASGQLNALRYLLRLAKDLRIFPLNSYGFGSERIDEIGRMLGSWQKQQKERSRFLAGACALPQAGVLSPLPGRGLDGPIGGASNNLGPGLVVARTRNPAGAPTCISSWL